MGLEARCVARYRRQVSEGPARLETKALQFRYPKPVIDKRGVKAGQAVSVLGVSDTAFLRAARARAGALVAGRAARDSDLIFFGVTRLAELAKLKRLRETMRRDGAIWVVWKKGQPALKEDHVRAAALRCGLVDVKVVAFSASHSALKLMIRKADR